MENNAPLQCFQLRFGIASLYISMNSLYLRHEDIHNNSIIRTYAQTHMRTHINVQYIYLNIYIYMRMGACMCVLNLRNVCHLYLNR